jgi:hypothetical protein
MSGGRGFRGDSRGQTLQDFATGISVFVVVVAATITLLPPVLAPFDAPITSDQSALAGRVGDETVRSLTFERSDNRLDAAAVTDFFSPSSYPRDQSDLRSFYGLGADVQVNVTLDTGAATDPAVGAAYRDRPVAAVVRVVTDGGNRCRPTCRIVVRVW